MLRDILAELSRVPFWAWAFMANCVLMLWYVYRHVPELECSHPLLRVLLAPVLAVMTGFVGFVCVIGFLLGEYLEGLAWEAGQGADTRDEATPATEDPWPRR